jgi:hypothetical protein
MEDIISFKDVIYGYENDGSTQAVVALQDGAAKISYGTFSVNERVLNFVVYRGELFMVIVNDTADTGRMLRLDRVVVGGEDSWAEVVTATSLDTAPQTIEFYQDLLYLFSGEEVWSWDGTALASVSTSLPSGVTWYSALGYRGMLYMYGLVGANNILYSYDGQDTFVVLDTFTAISLPVGFEPSGKSFLAIEDGEVYYPRYSAPYSYLSSYGPETGLLALERYNLEDRRATALFALNGVIFVGYTNVAGTGVNILTYVPKPFEVIETLPGNGVNGGLVRVKGDPVFMKMDDVEFIKAFREYPVMASLKNTDLPYVFKYSPRLELYTDLGDVAKLFTKSLKEIMDELCTITDSTFRVDSGNLAIVNRKDLVGIPKKFMTVTDGTEGGANNFLKELLNITVNPYNYKRIVITWENEYWESDAAGVAGSMENSPNAVFEISSDFINDPILAKNAAEYLLGRMVNGEKIEAEFGFAYFLEGDEVLGFKLDDNVVVMGEDREWKMVGVEHDFKAKTTILNFWERNLVKEKDLI